MNVNISWNNKEIWIYIFFHALTLHASMTDKNLGRRERTTPPKVICCWRVQDLISYRPHIRIPYFYVGLKSHTLQLDPNSDLGHRLKSEKKPLSLQWKGCIYLLSLNPTKWEFCAPSHPLFYYIFMSNQIEMSIKTLYVEL